MNAIRNIHTNVLLNWPRYSPDLSPIEIIWEIMGKREENPCPKSIPELIQILNDVWYNQSAYSQLIILLIVISWSTKMIKTVLL